MSATVQRYDQVAVLTPKEDLVGEDVEVFESQGLNCQGDGCFNLVVDLSNVATLDSRTLEVLLNWQNLCEDQLGAVKLCFVNETCVKILEITRLARRFEVFDDLESAVKSFS